MASCACNYAQTPTTRALCQTTRLSNVALTNFWDEWIRKRFYELSTGGKWSARVKLEFLRNLPAGYAYWREEGGCRGAKARLSFVGQKFL